MARFKTLLLFGAPGSGKGTQGKILGQIQGYVHVACGEVFRNLKVGSPLGSVFLEYSSRGSLVPDAFTVKLWREYIDGLVSSGAFDPSSDILILDGIPRNAAQARLMEEHIEVLRVYYLDCLDKDLMTLRLKRRALRENRLDDASDAVIKNRLYVYEAESQPVLDYYPKDRVRRIDSGKSPLEVLSEIIEDMKSIQNSPAKE